MLFEILLIIIGACVGLYYIYDSSFMCGFFEWCVNIFVGLIYFVVILIIGILINVVISHFISLNLEDTKLSIVEIYSVTDNVSQNSRFILGTGGSSSSIKYYVAVKEDYGKKIIEFSSKDTYLKETTASRYTLTTYEKRVKETFFTKYIFTPILTMNEFYVLTIPSDAIKIHYSIDME